MDHGVRRRAGDATLFFSQFEGLDVGEQFRGKDKERMRAFGNART